MQTYGRKYSFRPNAPRDAGEVSWMRRSGQYADRTAMPIAAMRLCPGPLQGFRNAQHRNVPAQARLQRVAQHRRGASIRTRRRLYVMGIEDQPAVLGDGLVECAIDLLEVDLHLDQRCGAQILQIHDAAVDAGNNAAHRTEDIAEPPLVRHRAETVRIGKS